jgi:GPH family glycoside/pentoside/hexuronide:cation symporter
LTDSLRSGDGAGASLPLRLKLLYSTGDLTTSIPLTIVMFFRFLFLTDIVGLGPGLAGWVVLAGRLWDAVNDPLIGQWADRIHSGHGRRRLLLLIGAVPLSLFFVMMWIVPGGIEAELALAIYFAFAFIAFDTMYTVVHIGYNALTPQLTRDYDERSSLNGYRMVFAIGGTLGALIFKTVLGWYVLDEALLYRILGIGLGLFCVAPPFVVFFITKNYASAEHEPPPQTPLSLRESLSHTLKNRPFWMVMGLYLFSWTTASIMASMLAFYVRYYMGLPEQADYVVLTAQFAAILLIPVTVALSRRFDKRRAFMIGCAWWVVVLLAIAGLGPDQIAMTYALAAASGLGIATAYVVPWSMIPDLIEIDQRETGRRREGSYYSFVAFFQKLATGIALWGVGQALDFTGYVTPLAESTKRAVREFGETIATAPAAVQLDAAARADLTGLVGALTALPAQSEATIVAFRLFMGPVPAALLVCAIVCAWSFPIDRESHQALVAELEGEAASAGG